MVYISVSCLRCAIALLFNGSVTRYTCKIMQSFARLLMTLCRFQHFKIVLFSLWFSVKCLPTHSLHCSVSDSSSGEKNTLAWQNVSIRTTQIQIDNFTPLFTRRACSFIFEWLTNDCSIFLLVLLILNIPAFYYRWHNFCVHIGVERVEHYLSYIFLSLFHLMRTPHIRSCHRVRVWLDPIRPTDRIRQMKMKSWELHILTRSANASGAPCRNGSVY